jgi:hypothetical protein
MRHRISSVSLLAAPETAVGGDDRRWKVLTARGNAAFAAKRWDEAESLYIEALAEADTVFGIWCEGQPAGTADPAPMLVVATANLAECLLVVGQPSRAGDRLVALRRRLCAVIESREARPGVREQCFLQLRPLVAELVDKLPRAGWRQEQIEREVEQMRTVAPRYLAKDTTRH